MTTVLGVHTGHDGRVWLDTVQAGAVATRLAPPAFATTYSDMLGAADRVRVLGTAANAALIVAINPHALKRVQIAAPTLLPTAAQRQEPSAVLGRLRQPPVGANACWCTLTASEYLTYVLIAAAAGHLPPVATQVLTYHPAWPALAFPTPPDAAAAQRLLVDIIDPRWYRHPTHPLRLTRLYGYLGLTEPNLIMVYQALSSGGTLVTESPYVRRAYHAVAAWWARPGPCQQVYEQWGSNPIGLLRATQYLIRFVATVWTCALAQHQEVKFNPCRFFPDAAMAAAFVAQQHVPS